MDEKIKVSVIIPTYNRCGTILRSVKSVLNQTYRNIECIIVDDCSQDDTESVIRQLKDDRICYIKSSRKLGAAKSRNVGISHSKGEVVAFNDSDDVWKEEKLIRQLEVLSDKKQYGMVYCPYMHIVGNIKRRIPYYGIPRDLLCGRIFESLLESNKIGTPTMIIKKECLLKVGGFDDKLKALEDYDLALRIAREYEIGYVDDCLVDVYSIDEGVNSNAVNVTNACIQIMNKLKDAVNVNGLFQTFWTVIPLIKDLDMKKQVIRNMLSDKVSDKKIINGLIEISRRQSVEMEKEKAIAAVLKLVDYTKLWYKIFDYLKVRNVAVYGCGVLGQILADQLSQTDTCFWGIIDRGVVEYNGKVVYNTTNIPEEIELIIITIYNSEFKKDHLVEKTKARLLTLDEFAGFLL